MAAQDSPDPTETIDRSWERDKPVRLLVERSIPDESMFAEPLTGIQPPPRTANGAFASRTVVTADERASVLVVVKIHAGPSQFSAEK
jgi:hypothetical protein